jgi:DNA-binding PadR family transcriptional regulator
VGKRRKVSNLLALAVLSVLLQRPMHPYEMATVLRALGKEQDMKVNWGSFYTVIANLAKHGLIEATETHREGRRPERTVYRITDDGRAELIDWVRELLAFPEREQPKFEAALSVAGVLPPAEVAGLLRQRLHALDGEVASQEAAIRQWSKDVPRLFLIEAEYHLAMVRAEAEWVRGLVAELAEGTMPGLDQWRSSHETGTYDPEWVDLFERSSNPQP